MFGAATKVWLNTSKHSNLNFRFDRSVSGILRSRFGVQIRIALLANARDPGWKHAQIKCFRVDPRVPCRNSSS